MQIKTKGICVMNIHFNVEKIEAMMDTFNLSQGKLGKRLGISQVYLSQILSGKRPITNRVQEELNRVYLELMKQVKTFEEKIS
ncbi:helix-turn-helix transcriptional regulator [Halobacillus halophilus]|uniref:helix-turn-helix transcriptional regulator n=1 Tax=Halobacillus halophilus TaxID=1570 RepID=UPI0019260F31|nr:helix-turn-helix transcriptional regulator [Halobacillus halophilus]